MFAIGLLSVIARPVIARLPVEYKLCGAPHSQCHCFGLITVYRLSTYICAV